MLEADVEVVGREYIEILQSFPDRDLKALKQRYGYEQDQRSAAAFRVISEILEKRGNHNRLH